MRGRVAGIIRSSVMADFPERALAAGDPFPPLRPDHWRIYSMRFCPYAQRTRMVLLHKNIPHEVVNVNLKYKPDWFLKRNPWGLAPTIELNNKVIYESAICDDYLDEIYPEKPLYPKDAYKKARQKILMDHFSKVIPLFYTQIRQKGDPVKLMAEIKERLSVFERELNGNYFGGESEASIGMLDLRIWPWFERFQVPKQNGVDILEGFPKLQSWTERMMQEPVVKATYFPPEMHQKWFVSLFINKAPDYDIGLPSKL
uniref:Glutathione S-transferase omega n=1 Tax=Perinereis aibuhitensis TaxID=126650 RepID=K4IZI4_PERAI|nr:omega class glutathione S-transferase [Perinereis aibuhitensis]